jgi:hypothetical protein
MKHRLSLTHSSSIHAPPPIPVLRDVTTDVGTHFWFEASDSVGAPVKCRVEWKHDLLVHSRTNSACYYLVGEFKPDVLDDYDMCAGPVV